jgi:hypothetical protein
LLALFLVVVFTGVAWDDSGGDGKYLGMDVAVGVGATGVIFACWWLVKRSLAGAKRAFRDALALERQQRRNVLPPLSARRQSLNATPVVRDVAGRAGRFVGTLRRAYREGRSDNGQPGS